MKNKMGVVTVKLIKITTLISLLTLTLLVLQLDISLDMLTGYWLKSNYQWQTDVWVEAVKSGKFETNYEIAIHVFGKSEPREELKDLNSYPFFTHHTLRSWLDWDFERNLKLTPGPAKLNNSFEDGDSIFVKTDFLPSFASRLGAEINKSFILITGNSAHPASYMGVANTLLNSPLLISWFAQNPDILHPKLRILPVGLENAEYRRLGDPQVLIKLLNPEVPVFQPGHNSESGERPILSYINFTPRPEYPDRTEAFDVLSNISYVLDKRITAEEYAIDLKRSKFTVSPRGVGWDCLRTWESVLFGSIPIVLYSPYFSEIYSQSPVMVVNSWSEVTKERLEKFTVNTTDKNVVFVDYWLQKILDVRDNWKREQF